MSLPITGQLMVKDTLAGFLMKQNMLRGDPLNRGGGFLAECNIVDGQLVLDGRPHGVYFFDATPTIIGVLPDDPHKVQAWMG